MTTSSEDRELVLPSPEKDESQNDFISRCMSSEEIKKEFGSGTKQAQAVCFDRWRSRNNSDGRSLRTANISIEGPAERRTFMGRPHLVVPVVALREGILQAANAPFPEFVPASSFQHHVAQWNGRVVVLDHPQENGILVSANDPEKFENEVIGHTFAAQADNEGLRFEAWLDIEKARNLGGEDSKVIDRLENGEVVEVSIGAFVDVEPRSGEHDGRRFFGVWRDITSDHLALLSEGTVGACSTKDGCGANRAAEGEDTEGILNESILDAVLSQGENQTNIPDDVLESARTRVRSTLKRELEGLMSGEDKNKDGGRQTAAEEKIKSLVEDKRTKFTEDDREFLAGLSEEQLDKMFPVEQEGESNPTSASDGSGGQDGEGASTSTNTSVSTSEGEGDGGRQTAAQSVEDYIENAPEDLRSALREAKKASDDKRNRLISTIRGSKRNAFTEDELKVMSTEYLEKLASLAKEENYEGQAGVHRDTSAYEPPKPPSLSEKLKEKRKTA